MLPADRLKHGRGRLFISMRRLVVVVMTMATVTIVSGAVDPVEIFNGKSGHALKSSVSVAYRPGSLLSEGDVVGAVSVLYPHDYGNGSVLSMVMPGGWWHMDAMMYGDSTRRDLYNIICMPGVIAGARTSEPLGPVVKTEREDMGWTIGLTKLGDVHARLVSPPDSLKGDVARCVFYMSTLYPCSFWDNSALAMMADGVYPGLSQSGMNSYLRWHREDPVSDWERLRSDAIGLIQGNLNPFVEMPLLVEYIWGDMKGEPYVDESLRQPLRSRYDFNGSSIDLFLPFVPEDARWSIDGTVVTGRSVSPALLGRGVHRFEFVSAIGKMSGSVKIEVI